MEQSIRNQLPGTIKSIVSDKVLSEADRTFLRLFDPGKTAQNRSLAATRWAEEHSDATFARGQA